MKLYIKYMVSRRCRMTVQAELDKLGLHYGTIDLGEVNLEETIGTQQRDQLRTALSKLGFELMSDKLAKVMEKVKTVIINMVPYVDERQKTKNSEYISKKLDYDYAYLATLFSEVTGISIEHYIIANKIERVKELLLYDELSLTQIADQLNYRSVACLSSQFRKVTGLSPKFYKQLKTKDAKPLEVYKYSRYYKRAFVQNGSKMKIAPVNRYF